MVHFALAAAGLTETAQDASGVDRVVGYSVHCRGSPVEDAQEDQEDKWASFVRSREKGMAGMAGSCLGGHNEPSGAAELYIGWAGVR